jgi:hypothetical protein
VEYKYFSTIFQKTCHQPKFDQKSLEIQKAKSKNSKNCFKTNQWQA